METAQWTKVLWNEKSWNDNYAWNHPPQPHLTQCKPVFLGWGASSEQKRLAMGDWFIQLQCVRALPCFTVQYCIRIFCPRTLNSIQFWRWLPRRQHLTRGRAKASLVVYPKTEVSRGGRHRGFKRGGFLDLDMSAPICPLQNFPVPAAKRVEQKEFGEKWHKKVTEASERWPKMRRKKWSSYLLRVSLRFFGILPIFWRIFTICRFPVSWPEKKRSCKEHPFPKKVGNPRSTLRENATKLHSIFVRTRQKTEMQWDARL